MQRLIFALFVVLSILSSFTSASKLICNRPHEFYDCGSACQTTCATLNQPCPIINIRCNDDCYCKKGYARDCRDVCIPISKCPGKGCRPRKPCEG
ncbi:PREDICTED: inducible metalloproteinase inhibitor protein-like [Dufourea novaeangliae]|uniref:Inducible metalloproteinase inhibitor protein n=1 Tax=Dufourea novaeangliae TaxID=178035 RepID=A0A154PME2_DUFNO|nr:PREDICTED: inducible metalloproteinase inhibitor protein-like [Dufourea novaeangliae]KZC13061.1 Inducible metalloproteinase inhibitor protein [Dufourea novaeangliae]